MSEIYNPDGFSGSHQAKKLVALTALKAVGVAFELAAKWDPEVQREIADWNDNEVFAMGVLPKGPFISVRKVGRDRVEFLGTGMKNPDVGILFKNLDAAMMVFTGQIGTHIAAAERRFLVLGNLSECMKISRTLQLVQAFLLPGFIVRKSFKRAPQFTRAQKITKAKIYAAFAPLLAAKMLKKVD